MPHPHIFFAHSGGVTAALNATACGVIQTARTSTSSRVYAGEYGILGAIHERLIDTTQWSDQSIQALYHTPSSAFGSCRYKLGSHQQGQQELERIFEVFDAHQIGYFIYNGGNDSQDTTHRISQYAQHIGYPLRCIGLPKTIDNDLPHTDTCPGFGSAAKYIATSVQETALDVQAMHTTSTKVFILEVMGRDAGWLAASSALAQRQAHQAPHLILLPEVPFKPQAFIQAVQHCVSTNGFCIVVASEGIQDTQGRYLNVTQTTDAFGHNQLGGVAPQLAHLVQTQCTFKTHWACADYLQRSARHLASQCDIEQAYTLGQAAIHELMKGTQDVMLTLTRQQSQPYRWGIGHVPLDQVANATRTLPPEWIRSDGFHITPECKAYLAPFIEGEASIPYHKGLPDYPNFPITLAPRQCPIFKPDTHPILEHESV
ncbi:MAG: 6-phosphofructokinase [Legionellales bacterium]|nr:6-phosphofructokinase [Legionellales bacterium]|tara:strand:+ start:388 stop:1674 length:1287 start_codon:yes stop_codon:yes gene_type:complete